MKTFKSEQHLIGRCRVQVIVIWAIEDFFKCSIKAAPHINTAITILNQGKTTPFKDIHQVRNNLNFAFESHI